MWYTDYSWLNLWSPILSTGGSFCQQHHQASSNNLSPLKKDEGIFIEPIYWYISEVTDALLGIGLPCETVRERAKPSTTGNYWEKYVTVRQKKGPPLTIRHIASLVRSPRLVLHGWKAVLNPAGRVIKFLCKSLIRTCKSLKRGLNSTLDTRQLPIWLPSLWLSNQVPRGGSSPIEALLISKSKLKLKLVHRSRLIVVSVCFVQREPHPTPPSLLVQQGGSQKLDPECFIVRCPTSWVSKTIHRAGIKTNLLQTKLKLKEILTSTCCSSSWLGQLVTYLTSKLNSPVITKSDSNLRTIGLDLLLSDNGLVRWLLFKWLFVRWPCWFNTTKGGWRSFNQHITP